MTTGAVAGAAAGGAAGGAAGAGAGVRPAVKQWSEGSSSGVGRKKTLRCPVPQGDCLPELALPCNREGFISSEKKGGQVLKVNARSTTWLKPEQLLHKAKEDSR